MKRLITPLLVILVMVIAILGITNPGFKQPYRLFENTEGRLMHNYFILSVYQQFTGYTLSRDGKYIIYKRFIGVALNFYEISPLRIERKQEDVSDKP